MGKLKNTDEIAAVFLRHISTTYRRSSISAVTGAPDAAYPKKLNIASFDRSWSLKNTDAILDWSGSVRAFAASSGLLLDTVRKRIVTVVELPSHLTLPDFDTAVRFARMSSDGLYARIRTLLSRLDDVMLRFGADAVVRLDGRALSTLESMDSFDFALALEASSFFDGYDAAGLTPRQVPIPGFSAKWLTPSRLHMIEVICGCEIELLERPFRIDFAYLDPAHAERGGRRYDSWMPTDPVSLDYVPDTVVIVENKDNMLGFPQIYDRAICVYGEGNAACAHLASVPWISDCGNVIYWGDMDVDGFRILDRVRASGIPVRSMYMDEIAYDKYCGVGTCLSAGSRLIVPLGRPECDELVRALGTLTVSEAAALRKCACDGPVRRIEQERIPYPETLPTPV